MADASDPKIVGELLALIAHDLRNPLSALHSNLGFLGSVLESADEDTRDAINDGLVSCDGLSHVIDNVDLFGHVLRSAEVGYMGPVLLGGVIGEVVARCEPVAQSHGLSVEIERSTRTTELEVKSNREMLARSLGNLVRNSVQHSPSTSVVRVQARQQGAFAEVLIVDRGTPIPEEFRKKVFTAAGQVSAKSMSNGRYSRGMGLFSARIAADLAGATVAILEPDESNNNRFVLRVPLAAAAP